MSGAGVQSGLIGDAHFLMRCLRYRFRTEKLQIRTMMRLDLRGATVLDIGANKGIYCFWMLLAVGSSGSVVAFEPQPEMRAAIEQRKARLRWSNLEVLGVALSDVDGHSHLSRQKIGDGSATLEPSRHRDENKIIDVPIARLDALPESMFANLKFIKCDVEGDEINVFRGGEQTIRRYRPVVQFESTVTDPRTADILGFFSGLGYSGIMMLGNKYLHHSNPDRLPHYKFGLEGHRDFLMVPPEAIGTTVPADLARLFPQATNE